MKQKALLIGGGAREHALADALIAGGAELYAFMANRNPGIYRHCKEFILGSVTDAAAITNFARKVKPGFVVIGPEAPLDGGVADELGKEGFSCVGPTKELAQLETSKSFTRELMQEHTIQGLPKFKVFSSTTGISEWLARLGSYVVKPDGLTGGKGVKVLGEHLQNDEEAERYCEEIISQQGKVVIEEKLEGEEFTLQSLTDGRNLADCPPVQDHKRAFEDDTGPNTGGMGSYSMENHLLPFLTEDDVEEAHKISGKVLAALRSEHGIYKGVLYGGFMATADGIKLLEYNARFGDPEAMNVLPLMKTNFVDACRAVVDGELDSVEPAFEQKATVCKYVVPAGYPDKPAIGKIEMPGAGKGASHALVYYASVDEKDNGIYTTKSRAVAFVGIASDIRAAERIAEDAARSVQGAVYHRKDIGTQPLLQKRVEHLRRLRKR